MWQADGWGWRARIGVLIPHADIGAEAEFQAMAPDGVSIHSARVPMGAYGLGGAIDCPVPGDAARAFADPPLVDDAAELLAAAPLHAIAYCFSSSSYVRGPAEDVALKARLEARTRGIPIVIIPRLSENSKIPGVDDAEVVGDLVAETMPVSRHLLTQEVKDRRPELGEARVAFVVSDMPMHQRP